jgi:hypothetical protein
MAEKDIVHSGKINQSGIFNFREMYTFAYDWLNDHGYVVTETNYSEKVSGDSKDIDITWDATREVSDYFKFSINLSWRILGLKKTTVKREGKEITSNTGIIGISFRATLIKDYENRWEDHPSWKFLRGVYDRYIIRSRIEQYRDKLIAELDEVIEQCKAYLRLETA